jgi:hypothetical protein
VLLFVLSLVAVIIFLALKWHLQSIMEHPQQLEKIGQQVLATGF